MKQNTIWHNEDEEPKRGSLILLIMQSGTAIVAKIIEPNHTFNHGERWAYIDDLLEKQNEPNNQERRKFTREEQIQKLIDEEIGIDNYGSSDYQVGVCDGVRLADKTMIEKACKWLLCQEEIIGISFERDFIERFKKAMGE